MAITADEFRAAMGCWASGVTIITTRAGERVHGMTVSDFSGLSMSPALVTVCASKSSVTTGLISEGKCFAVNVLAAGQEPLSNKFASKKDEFSRFDGLETEVAVTGAPLIPGALVHLDCRLEATHDGGDHLIFVGAIEEARVHPREPLLYFNGAYGRFQKV